MTKPHEDTLLAEHQGVARALVSASDGRMVCAFREQDIEAWEPLLRAAPEMAQALLHVLSCKNVSGQCPSCRRQASAALAKAGVQLP